MKITMREAKRRFERGETIYCYPKETTRDWIHGDPAQFKPMPIKKYDVDTTFEEQYEIVKMCGKDGWLST